MANLLNNNMSMMVCRDIMGQRIIRQIPKHQDIEKVELKVKLKVVKKQDKVKEEKKVKEVKEKKEPATCKAILSSGPNAGYACSNKIAKGNKKYCGMHSEKK